MLHSSLNCGKRTMAFANIFAGIAILEIVVGFFLCVTVCDGFLNFIIAFFFVLLSACLLILSSSTIYCIGQIAESTYETKYYAEQIEKKLKSSLEQLEKNTAPRNNA